MIVPLPEALRQKLLAFLPAVLPDEEPPISSVGSCLYIDTMVTGVREALETAKRPRQCRPLSGAGLALMTFTVKTHCINIQT
jgi:hypothetical protein